MTDSPRLHTKLDILRYMFDELAITNGVFIVTPEMQDIALRRMDAMLAEWEADGIALGYNYPGVYGQGEASDDSGLQDAVVQIVATNLAVRVAPTIGKQISAETRKAANSGLAMIRARTATTPSMSLPSRQQMGQGNRRTFIGTFAPSSDAESAL